MRTIVRGVVCSSNGSSSVVAFFSHRSHASRVCVDQTRARKTVRGKKMLQKSAAAPKRGSNGIRKFNPSVCGFFAIGGRCRICRRINNRICGWHVRQELYRIAYCPSTVLPLLPPITLCKILVYILVYISFNFLRRDVRNLNM